MELSSDICLFSVHRGALYLFYSTSINFFFLEMNQELFAARRLDCRLVHSFNALQCNPGFPYPIEPKLLLPCSVYSQEVYGKSLPLDKNTIFSA